MPIIKAVRKDGQRVTNVIPESYRKKEIEQLKNRGYTNIHDAETGEKYN